jgi:hypothetical protein
MTPGGRPRGGGYNWLAWIDSSIYIYSMIRGLRKGSEYRRILKLHANGRTLTPSIMSYVNSKIVSTLIIQCRLTIYKPNIYLTKLLLSVIFPMVHTCSMCSNPYSVTGCPLVRLQLSTHLYLIYMCGPIELFLGSYVP